MTITHPFHPLRGQRFEVLILRHPDRGSYAIAREWTDWDLPETSSGPAGTPPKLVVEPLLQLAKVLIELTERVPEALDE